MTYLIAVPLSVLFALPLAFVGRFLWMWFLTPVIGIPAPGFLGAIGLVFFVALVFSKFNPTPKRTTEESIEWLREMSVFVFIRPFVYLAVGWLVHQFMVGAL